MDGGVAGVGVLILNTDGDGVVKLEVLLILAAVGGGVAGVRVLILILDCDGEIRVEVLLFILAAVGGGVTGVGVGVVATVDGEVTCSKLPLLKKALSKVCFVFLGLYSFALNPESFLKLRMSAMRTASSLSRALMLSFLNFSYADSSLSLASGFTMDALTAALCLPAVPFFLTTFLGYCFFEAFLNPSSESPSQSESDSFSE